MQHRRRGLCVAFVSWSVLIVVLLCLITSTDARTEITAARQCSSTVASLAGPLANASLRAGGAHLYSPLLPGMHTGAPLLTAGAGRGDGVVEYWAVLVGIADFVGTLNDLTYTDDDALDMQAALLSYPNWDPTHIQLLLDTQGTKANIQAAIQTMGSNADDDDVCVFFYSSHGTTYSDTPPLDETDGLDEAICTYNIGVEDILDDELGTWLGQLPTSSYAVVIDTCHSGGQIKDGLRVKGIGSARPQAGDGFAADIARLWEARPRDLDDNAAGVVITACDDWELSYEDPTLQNGVFTYYVVEGMGGPADANANTEISVEELYNYAGPLAASSYPQNAQLYDGHPGELELSAAGDRPPGAARNVIAIDTPNDEGESITVSWRRSSDDGSGWNDVTKYEVHRADGSAAGPFTNVSGDLAPGTQTYVDTPTVDGTDYYYFVRVHDAAYQTDSPVVGPVQSRDDLAPPQITNLTAKDRDSDQGGAVELAWGPYSAPADFAEYRLYRSVTPYSDVTGMTPVVTISDGGVLSYLDQAPELENGTEYWYGVTAVDDTVPPNENTAVITASAIPAIDFEHTFPLGVSLAAVPAYPFDPSPVTIFGVSPPPGAELARWDPVMWPEPGYHYSRDDPNDPFLSILPGRAFWLKLPSSMFVSVDGTAVAGTSGDSFSIPIVSGWQQMGNPFTTAVDFTTATVTVAGGDKTLDEASASGIAENYAWLYNAGAGSYQLIHGSIPFALQSVPTYHGVWYRAYTSATLNLPKPVGALAVRPRAAVTRQPSAQDWAIPVVASIPAENVSDSATVLGVHPNAAAVTHIQSPPNPAGYVDVYFPAADGQAGPRYATDFVAGLGSSRTWALVVDTDIGDAEVELSFPNLSELPRDCHAFLVDTDAGRRQSLRTRASYRFASGAAGGERHFTVEVTTNGGAMLAVSGLRAVPTRGPAVDIAFDLSQPAHVQVEVLNAAGRRLGAVAVDGMLPKGRSAVVWNGRSARGTPVPAGVYVVRVNASAEDGEQASGVTALALTR